MLTTKDARVGETRREDSEIPEVIFPRHPVPRRGAVVPSRVSNIAAIVNNNKIT